MNYKNISVSRVAAADVVDVDYRMQEHKAVPVIVGLVWLAIMVGGLGLAYKEFGETVSVFWFVLALVVLSVFSFGMWRNQFYLNAWPALMANTSALYIVDSQMGDIYLRIPWPLVLSCKAGMYSLNVKGLLFTVKKTELADEALGLLQQASFVAKETDQSITVGLASGMQNREKVIGSLRSLYPKLGD